MLNTRFSVSLDRHRLALPQREPLRAAALLYGP